MSSQQPSTQRGRREEIVLAHVAAENSGDLDATIASFHRPRYNVIAMGAISDGEEAVRQLVGGLVAAFPDFHFEIGKLHHADEAVIVEGMVTGTHKGDWAGMQARGRRMELPIACIFDFEGDRLINESLYFDFATLQRQLTA
jgi:steroid delta-isomerase-like uncharacterized protein